MNNFIMLYINGQKHQVRDHEAFMPLANYLRYSRQKTGTKIVCAEGDCGACSVLYVRARRNINNSESTYQAMNSCIAPVYRMNGCHVVTVEGLCQKNQAHPVQESMSQNHGGQCGYCTPGMVIALTAMFEKDSKKSEQRIRNHLTGNLCRCTGYAPIINSAMATQTTDYKRLNDRYNNPEMWHQLKTHISSSAVITSTSEHHQPATVFLPNSTKEATNLKAQHPEARIVAAATDVGVAINKGRSWPQIIISLTHIEELWENRVQEGTLRVGANTSLTDFEILATQHLEEMSSFLRIFASPQIKNVATLVGNLANASPVADTVPFLFAADAIIVAASSTKIRRIAIDDFILGYKKLALQPDEIITHIEIPIAPTRRWRMFKLSLRKDLDISAVNAVFSYDLDKNQRLQDVRVSYGGVREKTIRCKSVEKFLNNTEVTKLDTEELQKRLASEITPISDVRASAAYRSQVAANFIKRFTSELNQTPPADKAGRTSS